MKKSKGTHRHDFNEHEEDNQDTAILDYGKDRYLGEEMKPYFSVNDYDKDGDIVEYGIYLHFGDTRVLVAGTIHEFKRFVDRISSMSKEIEENYPSEIVSLTNQFSGEGL